MEWQLTRGTRVRYRAIGEEREHSGTVRKALHVLDAEQRPVPVYVVEPDDDALVVLGDGEILDTLRDATAG